MLGISVWLESNHAFQYHLYTGRICWFRYDTGRSLGYRGYSECMYGIPQLDCSACLRNYRKWKPEISFSVSWMVGLMMKFPLWINKICYHKEQKKQLYKLNNEGCTIEMRHSRFYVNKLEKKFNFLKKYTFVQSENLHFFPVSVLGSTNVRDNRLNWAFFCLILIIRNGFCKVDFVRSILKAFHK